MARYCQKNASILVILLLIICVESSIREGFKPEILHTNELKDISRPKIISRDDFQNDFGGERHKRDTNNDSNKTITNNDVFVKVNPLKDSHAQLMVHWLGYGSNVMICLARDPPISSVESAKLPTDVSPSAVYFSYDYGDTFINKTHLFSVTIEEKTKNAILDQFLTHPKFDTIIFTDSRNKAIFHVPHKGDDIKTYMLDFTPSDISFYENDPNTFLVHDKESPDRNLYYTTDAGITFTILQTYVKSFSWYSGEDMPSHLYVERKEPTNSSTIIFINAVDLLTRDSKPDFNLLIENVQDFHIKNDFMFAVRKVINTTQLWISYKRGPFVKADFQTELDIKGLHICDVEGTRILLSAAHSDVLSHLYVSESSNNMATIKFIPSLENIFTYIPNIIWTNGWIVQTTDEAFTDLYKVEGVRGVYIASKVVRSGVQGNSDTSLGPEHLVSLITYNHGVNWQPIKPPTVDDEKQLITCKDCSLHLSQKFCQLYPVTRSVTIMSSKLAPGVIMASGVIGKSMKGHPGVFLSRDAGLTWTQILKTYHFFNFGDHGGILVAVKYFKTKGETREVIYSTDEGDTWKSQQFHSNDLKIYGLMTEPNSNTTIFTLFGSEKAEHKWLIIKLDLRKAFERNCTEADYKFWTPSSKSDDSLVPCVLGVQTTFQRRIAHTNCYNGIDYKRIYKTETCVCNKWDFECDFGFSRANSNSHCTFNKSLLSVMNPFEIPKYCQPGRYYNRTRGYKKIEGDACIAGFENRYLPQEIPCPVKLENNFLLIAQRDRISRIDLNTFNKDELPVQKLQNVITIDFDMKNNCVFFADIISDNIARQCLNGTNGHENLVDTNLASVEGMSYDWISEMLFFVDGTRSKIEAVKTSNDSLFRMRTTIVHSKDLVKPRGIVVHPIEGYLFWTEWSTQKPSLSRCNLDGSDIKELFTKPTVVWPNGITIDYYAQRLYWVDASKDYIGSCDLNGDNFMKVIDQDNRVDHPFAVAVYKDQMFWDDWKMNLIFSADKDHGVRIQNISQQMSNLMDLKVYAHSLQEGKNGCEKHNCSHICVGAPLGKFSCLCPEGMVKSATTNQCLCPGGKPPFKNQTCEENGNTCGPGFFTCSNKLCISNAYRCDSHDDCGDNSDEHDCAAINPSCDPQMFTCKSDGKCIPEYFVCDFDIDCVDGSDEVNCTHKECKDDEFACANSRCVSNRWKCDGEDDCRDGSDEKGCPTPKLPVECKLEDFRCKSNGQCIPNQWRCDGEFDCRDSSDEHDCQNKKCDTWEFSCGNGKCIYRTWKCDGDIDCDNGEDEMNCTKVTPPVGSNNFFPSVVCHDWMFKCANNKCIPIWWKCDKVNDCGDDSDEYGCSNTNRNETSLITTTAKPNDVSPTKKIKCSVNQFECNSGYCISKRYVCDGTPDCSNGEDEVNCPPISRDICGVNHFRCKSDRFCLPKSKYCDGIVQCADRSDEENCDKPVTLKPDNKINCKPGFFICDNKCHILMERCDKKLDCFDGSDEENCENVKRVYQVTHFVIENKFLNATSFVLLWWLTLPSQNKIEFEYLPTISVAGKTNWTNHTTWISEKKHLFSQLVPYTTYNVTVYTRVKGENAAPPCFYTNVTTGAGIPTEPLNIKVTQLNGTRIQVDWSPPLEPYGKLISYTVYFRPQSNAMGAVRTLRVSSFDTTAIIEDTFSGNVTYEFWVRARNSQHESPSSKMVLLTFNDLTNMDIPKGIAYSYDEEKHILTLTWNPVMNADGYVIETYLPQPYPTIHSIKTNNTDHKFHNLVSGAMYIFKVSAYIGSYVGRPKIAKYLISGNPLPEIKARLQHDTDRLTLLWTEPHTDLKNLTYGVYYGTSVVELFEKPRIITQNKEVNLTDLMPCESYLISVGIVGPNGPGPLTHNPITLETSLNDKKPPKNLTATINSKTRYMVINWEHNCPISNTYPPYYLTVTETVLNKTVSIILKNRSSNKTLSHYFKNIPFGALYNVSVKANIKDAEEASIMVPAPSLEGPRQLKVWPERNGSFVVYWKELDNPYNFGFTYEIAIFRGILSNQNLNNIVTVNVFQSKVPPIIVNPEDLGGLNAIGQAFTFGIRIKTDEGYASEISETENIEFTQRNALYKENQSSSMSNVWLIIIPIALIASLVGVIVVLVQRHRRLQTSFSRFANSHYDTKTGATRICDTLEDEDSMPHQRDATRFADDEPLVIT